MKQLGGVGAIQFVETDAGFLALGAEGEGAPTVELTPGECGALVSASELWRTGREEVPTFLKPGVLAMSIRGGRFVVSQNDVVVASFTAAEAEAMETLVTGWAEDTLIVPEPSPQPEE